MTDKDRRLQKAFAVQLFFGLVCSGVVLLMLLLSPSPLTRHSHDIFGLVDLFFLSTYAAFIYGLVLTSERKARAEALEREAGPAETERDAFAIWAGPGAFMATPPAFALNWVGWQWSLPFYAFYFFYLLQFYGRWKRYRSALTAS